MHSNNRQPAIHTLEDALQEIERLQKNLNHYEKLLAAESSNHSIDPQNIETQASFLNSMSHEIRTPVSAIKGLSELLSMTKLDGLQQNYLQNIISASNSLISIIDDVLDFSQIKSNDFHLIETNYLLSELLPAITAIISPKAADKSLFFFVRVSSKIPSVLYGDSNRIKQILINLLSSAIKNTESGTIWLIVDVTEQNGAYFFTAKVEDTGAGIAPEELPHLFDAFSRADFYANRHISGTGLKLAVSKKLAVALGGDVTATSEQGKGTTFTLTIPQRVTSFAPLAEVHNTSQYHVLVLGAKTRTDNIAHMLQDLGVSYELFYDSYSLQNTPIHYTFSHCLYDDSFSAQEIYEFHKLLPPQSLFASIRSMRDSIGVDGLEDSILFSPVLVTELANFLNNATTNAGSDVAPAQPIEIQLQNTNILVVDDNEINLLVSNEMLSTFGPTVICANSGEKALEIASEQPFDLIFLDHMMPGMDGIDVTKALRATPGLNQNTPIVALTANVMNNIKSYYIDNGMDDFIGKPIDFNDLIRILYQWLPPEKFHSQEATLLNVPISSEETTEYAPRPIMQSLILSLDHYGLSASATVKELGGDPSAYFKLLEKQLPSLDALAILQKELAEKNWAAFSVGIDSLQQILYTIGARDEAAQASKISYAVQTQNTYNVAEDFSDLAKDIASLKEKLETVVSFANGSTENTSTFMNRSYIYSQLLQAQAALQAEQPATANSFLHTAIANSLDKDLETAVASIFSMLEINNTAGALQDLSFLLTDYKFYVEEQQNLT